MVIDLINIYLFTAIILTTFGAAYTFSRGSVAYVKVILFLSLAINVYMYGYSAELSGTSLAKLIFWNKFQYLGIPFISALWLMVGLLYTGYFYPKYKWKLAYVFIIPVLTLIFRFTNDFHHLYFTSIKITYTGDHYLLAKGKGIWYVVQMVHSLSMVLITFIVYTVHFFKRIKFDGAKIVYMLVASFFAVLGLFFNLLNVGKLNIDYMVIFLPVAVFLVLTAILRYDFLEIKVLARNIMFEKSEMGMLVLNNNSKIVDLNNAARTFFQEQDIRIKDGLLDIVYPASKKLAEVLKEDSAQIWMIDNNDTKRFFEIDTTYLQRADGNHYGRLKTIRNVTERHILQEHLKMQASEDELSGLLNRREFIRIGRSKMADNSLKKNKKYLIMLDIDHFKNINDRFGHRAGDITIQKTGEILKRHFRSADVVGRIGGEEFAVFLVSDRPGLAYDKAESVRKAIQNMRIVCEGNEFSVTISAGISVCDSDNYDFSLLLNKADKALYKSKDDGRNRTTVDY